MPPSKIMIVRHGEKPPDDPPGPPPYGVNADGKKKRRSLIVRGWQRSGALVPFFAAPNAPIETPDSIYAAAISDENDETKSRRPQETVTPLAGRLGLKINASFTVGQETPLAADIRSRGGVVLVAWEHKHIPLIAAAFCASAPSEWPDERFDLVWILTAQGATYRFETIDQSLLPGDA